MYVVERLTLIEDGTVNTEGFKQLAEQAMTVNPSVEVYLVDTEGNLVAHAMPPESIVHAKIPLAPIEAFLRGAREGRSSARILAPTSRRRSAPHPSAAASSYRAISTSYSADSCSIRYGPASSALSSAAWRPPGLLAVLIIGGIVGFYSVHRATRPLQQLEAGADHLHRKQLPGHLRHRTRAAQHPRGEKPHRQAGRVDGHPGHLLQQIDTNDRLRRELLANVSHDLRTPLASMQGYIRTLLIKDASLTREERRKYLGIAHNHTLQLNRLVSICSSSPSSTAARCGRSWKSSRSVSCCRT